ncbi:MAG: carbohydrate-binding domain-containing protein [Candidatus Moduliflexus flocculans]|nr:carbohydrate-binding domain-containing protein [Candidatus Moduliflexus flocculans]
MKAKRLSMKTFASTITLVMILLLVNGMHGVYAAPETWDISTGNLVISSGGTYAVTGSTASNTISVNTADPVTITLDNVSINVSAAQSNCPRQWRERHALPQGNQYAEE